MTKPYRVTYERDPEGWWVATVPRVKGCHTQGRTIEEARRRIREALALYVADADRATLEDDIKMPAKIRSALTRLQRVRVRADREQANVVSAARAAVKILRRDWGLSVRDAGTVLGLTGQRVHQLEH